VNLDDADRCPVMNVVWEGPPRPALAGHHQLDAVHAVAPVVTVPSGIGFRLVVGHDEVLRIAQAPQLFPQSLRSLATGEESPFELIPETLNGPTHTVWRRLLASYFSPRAIEEWDDRIRARANRLIDDLIDAGHCDFTGEFALLYPTGVFLELMGLPLDQLDDLLRWETDILHPNAADGPAAEATMLRAQGEVVTYFATMIAKRRAMPVSMRPPGLVTEALNWQIDGEAVSDGDLLSFYLLMFMAGLDTVTAELGYGFLHLATHPQDRQRIVDEPDLIPAACEELLRLYPIVNSPRRAAEDTEVNGCPIKQGEMLLLSFAGAGRDPLTYPDALTADFDRAQTRAHLTFGAGPHRCLGSHLARHELVIAYQEWHKRIPEYRLDEQIQCAEASGTMMTLNNLPLRWDQP
jgi:cytochrome P450